MYLQLTTAEHDDLLRLQTHSPPLRGTQLPTTAVEMIAICRTDCLFLMTPRFFSWNIVHMELLGSFKGFSRVKTLRPYSVAFA